jgi:hypothetical protein
LRERERVLTATHNLGGGLPIELGSTGLPDGDEELKKRGPSASFVYITESW